MIKKNGFGLYVLKGKDLRDLAKGMHCVGCSEALGHVFMKCEVSSQEHVLATRKAERGRKKHQKALVLNEIFSEVGT